MEFTYQRTQGKKATYRVTVTITRKCGEDEYRFRGKIFSADGVLAKVTEQTLAASDAALAMNKAISLMKTDIEQLQGMFE